MDRLKVHCRNCEHKHIPHSLMARYSGYSNTQATGRAKQIQLWQCKECGHIWQDTAFKKKS